MPQVCCPQRPLHRGESRSAGLLLICAAALLGLVFSARPASAETIRVGLRTGPDAPRALRLDGRGDWQARRARGRLDGPLRITSSRGSLVLQDSRGKTSTVGAWLDIMPSDPSRPPSLDGAPYRGALRIELQRSGALTVVNTLDIEDYLRGVVPSEIFIVPNALEAQAVVSRTLAVYIRDHQPRHPPSDGFDVCTTGHCQVYRGLAGEHPRANRAVDATRGEVLTFDGRVILAAYHANAGGKTAETLEAWPGSLRVAYLAPVDSPYDGAVADLGYPDCYRWTVTVTPEQARSHVRSATGQDVGQVRSMVVDSVWPSGRVRHLTVTGSRGRASISRPHDVRAVLGIAGEITGKSYDYDTRQVRITSGPSRFTITGFGAGEGVGLSQHGAIGMARAGFSYQGILAHYYRGVALAGDYGRGGSRRLQPPELPAGETALSVRGAASGPT